MRKIAHLCLWVNAPIWVFTQTDLLHTHVSASVWFSQNTQHPPQKGTVIYKPQHRCKPKDSLSPHLSRSKYLHEVWSWKVIFVKEMKVMLMLNRWMNGSIFQQTSRTEMCWPQWCLFQWKEHFRSTSHKKAENVFSGLFPNSSRILIHSWESVALKI